MNNNKQLDLIITKVRCLIAPWPMMNQTMTTTSMKVIEQLGCIIFMERYLLVHWYMYPSHWHKLEFDKVRLRVGGVT